jgi:type II secretory pathway pseudopilin PulG
MVAVLAVMSLLSLGILSSLGSYLEFSQRQSTRIRLEQLRESLERCMAALPYEIFSGPANSLTIAGNNLPDPTESGTARANRPAETSAAQWRAVRNCSSPSLEALVSDGFNRPWLLGVSNDLSLEVASARIRYRVAALVSTGANGRLESTFDATTGQLTAGGDDLAEVVDGIATMQNLHADALQKSTKVANAYREYFTTRYLASASRAYEVDYFARSDSSGNPLSPLWDGPSPEGQAGGVAGTTGGAAVPATDPELRLLDALGLSIADVTLRPGYPLRIDNSSPAVNNPDNPDPARTLPPFSARVIAPLPGGEVLITTASGVPD